MFTGLEVAMYMTTIGSAGLIIGIGIGYLLNYKTSRTATTRQANNVDTVANDDGQVVETPETSAYWQAEDKPC